MLNRKKQPPIYEVKDLKLPPIQHIYLDNQIPVYVINLGLQEVVKVEVVFHAGRPFESTPLASRATGSLIKEGTQTLSSSEIAEKIDFLGGSISTPSGLDTSNVVLQCLTKHFDQLLPLLAEMILTPAFPQKELDTFIENNIQGLQVELSKSDIVAYRQITENIFGKEHPYGYNSDETMYRNLERSALVEHYKANYHAGNCTIFISGKINDEMLKSLNTYFGKMEKREKKIFTPPVITTKPSKIFIEKKDSSQTAISIGRRLFSRNHEDFNTFFVLNTILGGYFGSRLMENIREEKGYTYNIYSASEPMLFDGYFYISTEVGNEYLKATKEEIYKEITILKNELIDKKELKMVKNYLLGNILTMIDGPFNVAEIVKSYVTENVPFENFEKIVAIIRAVSAEQLRDIACKYLQEEDLWEVVVGEKM
jgi:zinc protease